VSREFEAHRAEPANVRRTYLSTYSVDGEQLRLVVGMQIGTDGWRGVTAFDSKTIREILRRRNGTLAYRRPE